MSSAEMQAYLTGVVKAAIANDKANRDTLTYEVAKFSKLRDGLRGVALSALTAEQKTALVEQRDQCTDAEEAMATSTRELERVMALVGRQEQAQAAAKASASDVVLLHQLRTTSVMRELPCTKPSIKTSLGGDNPAANRTLQEYAAYLSTPLPFSERLARESPQGQLRSSLGLHPHHSRIVDCETTAAFHGVAEPYVIAMQGLARKKIGLDSPKPDDDGKAVFDRGLQGDRLTRSGLQLLYDSTQTTCKIYPPKVSSPPP